VIAAVPVPPSARPRLHNLWRAIAWVVAVFVGGIIVFVGGRVVGYLDGQRALDVVISSGIRRYFVLLPLVPVWAIVTTVLVTILLDGAPIVRRRLRRSADRLPLEVRDEPPRSSAEIARPDGGEAGAHRRTEGGRAGGRRAGGHPT
jgi:hypothetical protein